MDDIVEIGAKAQFDASGFVRHGQNAPDWNKHLSDRDREQGRMEFRVFRCFLREAGFVIVPAEPTEAMLRALYGTYLDNEGVREDCAEAYRAMVRAAHDS